MSEADVHFELYRHLQNAIEDNPERKDITFGKVSPEHSANLDGRADIVVFDAFGNPVFVVEAKRPDDGGSRDIDPYAQSVIRQAFRYAGDLGAPFFCTYNGERLVIFDAFSEGVPLLERSTKSYTISDVSEFADTLLDEVARLQAGDTKWDAIDDAFIDRIDSIHDYISPKLERSLDEKVSEDQDFRSEFVDWLGTQGIDYDDASTDDQAEIKREFAEQATYLLLNKIIFHKILENTPTYEDDIEPLAVSPYQVQDDLQDYFEYLVDNVDFEAIYEHDKIYSEIPLDPVADKLREFIIELDDRDLSQFDSDVIGRIYEGVIPPERRREMGEYYTPPAICDLITRLTVTDATDTVLDPACGSGGFLVSSYHRIRDMLPEPAGSHERILTQISGVEINRFPAHLSTINLAIQDLSAYTEHVDIEIKDFFNVKKYQRLRREQAGPGGGETADEVTEQKSGFDAVVANPPYIRQENIDDKDHVRDHLGNREINAEYISKRSDIYVYFLTHATEFLAEDGDLGFITSDRWLDTKYGTDMQEFILDNYEIRAIITFDRQVFDDALVDSSVLILRRQTEEDARDTNVAKFIRLKEEMDIENIEALVEKDYEENQMISNGAYRLVTRRQATLYPEDKWNVFFFAPPIYFDITADPNVVQLSEIANVSRGITTGANAFFMGNTEEMADLGIEEYTSPLLKATGQVDSIRVTEEDVANWRILDVHDLVRQALDETDDEFGTSDEELVKNWLRENGHTALLEYIESGEKNEYHERRTLESRDVWFDLENLPRPKILSTMFTWKVHQVYWNDPEAATSDQFYYVAPDEGVDEKVLAGVLNSRVVWLANELKGRRAGGEGMTRLQTKVYETETWPVPDPERMTEDERQAIIDAFEELMAKELTLDEPTYEATSDERDALDRAVISVLDFGDEPEAVLTELQHCVEAMIEMRDEGAGHRTTVLVEREERIDEDTGAIQLPGVEEARESTTLDDF